MKDSAVMPDLIKLRTQLCASNIRWQPRYFGSQVAQAIKAYKIDPDKPNPATV